MSSMGTHKGSNEESISAVNGTGDREARSKFWIAAYTRPKSEKKAAVELAKYGIETYVPIQSQIREWSDRRKKVEVVVIPMILFAKIAVEDILTVKKHPLIINVLTYPGQKESAFIPENQIDSLKFMLNQSDVPVLFEKTEYKQLDRVRIIRGNLQGLEGRIYRTNRGMTKLMVSINFLGGAIVTINPSDIEIVR